MNTKYWSGNYGIEIEMTRTQAQSCTHPGPCDNDVLLLSQMPEIAAQTKEWNPHKLVLELRGYGTWSDSELADHKQNIQRMLWMAAEGIADEYEDSDE